MTKKWIRVHPSKAYLSFAGFLQKKSRRCSSSRISLPFAFSFALLPYK
jgi:hypothetical protein